MDWLRLYTDILSDKKLRHLPVAQRWLWISILVLARQSEEPGRLLKWGDVPITPQDLSEAAAISLADVDAGLRSFLAQCMIQMDGRVLVVTHWKERQFESDTSTGRVRAYRERVKRSQGNVSRNVSRNGPRAEAESEAESESASLAASKGALPRVPPASADLFAHLSALPEGWTQEEIQIVDVIVRRVRQTPDVKNRPKYYQSILGDLRSGALKEEEIREAQTLIGLEKRMNR